MPASKFRKKPVVVEAVKWLGRRAIPASERPSPLLLKHEALMVGLGVGRDDVPGWLISAIETNVADVSAMREASIDAPMGYWVAHLRLRTLETNKSGWFDVTPGDWIVKGVRGELYAVKSDIFEETYEAAVDSAPVDEAVYLSLHKNEQGYYPCSASSLEEAKSRARCAVEMGDCGTVTVCQEIVSYSRSFLVVERPATKAAKGKLGEA